MPDWEADHESEHDVGVVTESQQHVKKPPLYKVLLHNDDFTTMEFVVDILRNVFHKSESDAVHIMLAVHEQGVGVAGGYTDEISGTKISAVTPRARTHGFPFLCTV